MTPYEIVAYIIIGGIAFVIAPFMTIAWIFFMADMKILCLIFAILGCINMIRRLAKWLT